MKSMTSILLDEEYIQVKIEIFYQAPLDNKSECLKDLIKSRQQLMAVQLKSQQQS